MNYQTLMCFTESLGMTWFRATRQGQSYDNVKFTLENESAFESCEKRWIVNRIIDPEEQERIVSLLEKHNQKYKIIPFDKEEYRQIEWDMEAFKDPQFF